MRQPAPQARFAHAAPPGQRQQARLVKPLLHLGDFPRLWDKSGVLAAQ